MRQKVGEVRYGGYEGRRRGDSYRGGIGHVRCVLWPLYIIAFTNFMYLQVLCCYKRQQVSEVGYGGCEGRRRGGGRRGLLRGA